MYRRNAALWRELLRTSRGQTAGDQDGRTAVLGFGLNPLYQTGTDRSIPATGQTWFTG